MSTYYMADGNRRKGPFAEGDLVANGLGRDTLVWREGLPDWLPAHRLETLTAVVSTIPPPVPRPAVPPPLPSRTARANESVAATSTRAWPRDEAGGMSSRGSSNFAEWWIYYLVTGIVTYLFGLVMFVDSHGLSIPLFLASFVAMKAIESILLYRLWSVVQDGEARATPGKAVGYLFIPFYSCYWFFVGVGGLAEEYDRVAERRGVAIAPISKPLGLVASGLCVLGVGMVPVLGVATLVVMLVYLRSVVRAADLIADETA